MAKPLVWTIRFVDKRTPFLWLLHEGPESAAFIARHVEKVKAMGFDVVVNLSSKPTRERGAR